MHLYLRNLLNGSGQACGRSLIAWVVICYENIVAMVSNYVEFRKCPSNLKVCNGHWVLGTAWDLVNTVCGPWVCSDRLGRYCLLGSYLVGSHGGMQNGPRLTNEGFHCQREALNDLFYASESCLAPCSVVWCVRISNSVLYVDINIDVIPHRMHDIQWSSNI